MADQYITEKNEVAKMKIVPTKLVKFRVKKVVPRVDKNIYEYMTDRERRKFQFYLKRTLHRYCSRYYIHCFMVYRK